MYCFLRKEIHASSLPLRRACLQPDLGFLHLPDRQGEKAPQPRPGQEGPLEGPRSTCPSHPCACALHGWPSSPHLGFRASPARPAPHREGQLWCPLVRSDCVLTALMAPRTFILLFPLRCKAPPMLRTKPPLEGARGDHRLTRWEQGCPYGASLTKSLPNPCTHKASQRDLLLNFFFNIVSHYVSQSDTPPASAS